MGFSIQIHHFKIIINFCKQLFLNVVIYYLMLFVYKK